jgi:RNA polymerase sigma-70 factor, ECF subfamily
LSDAGTSLKNEVLAAIPALRAFAMSLSGKSDRADDLVQETLMKAWANMSSYAEGTNLRAWLFAILRNIFYSQHRKRKREVEDVDGHLAARLPSPPEQISHMDFEDFRRALQHLPPDQREALILIGALGLSYEEAADVCDCAVGTIKSRVSRARGRLVRLLGLSSSNDFASDPQWRGALGGAVTHGSRTHS